MTLEIAPQVRELLSDEQIAAVDLQVETGQAPCVLCGEPIDPELGAASVVLIVDPGPRRAAARVSHVGCGPSVVTEAQLPEPGDARLAERWASFVLPGVPVIVLQADAAIWTGEREPALLTMLRDLGFERGREAFDSELFATGVGPPPRTDALRLGLNGEDLVLSLVAAEALEVLPGIATGQWGALLTERKGALIAVGSDLGLPDSGGIAFDDLLPVLLERTLAAWVTLRAREETETGSE